MVKIIKTLMGLGWDGIATDQFTFYYRNIAQKGGHVGPILLPGQVPHQYPLKV